MARTAAAPAVADASAWIPPTEWREVRPGIWEPPGYQPSAWELTPPAVATEEDELREYVRCANSLPYFALHHCLPGESPIWMEDYTFQRIDELRPGDRVIGWGPRIGYRAKQRQARAALQTAEVTAVTQLLPTPVVKAVMASGRTVRCTPDHLWCVQDRPSRNRFYREAKVGRCLSHVVDVPTPIPSTMVRPAAWLGGLYDGEGSRSFISQYQSHNPHVHAEIGRVLSALGFRFTAGPKGYHILGGRSDLTRFVNWCRPVRWNQRTSAHNIWVAGGCDFASDPIVSIEPDGVEPVYALTTTTGNYVAWGYGSKNCWTLHVDDPDGARPRRIPAYPYVREMLAALQTPSNTISEKSRQMLSSWIYMAAFLHDLLFVADAPELVVSRRQTEVDDGGAASTVDSLLGKLRFMHERLPQFLWHPFQFRRFHVQSLVTGTYVRGETGAGGQVARGPAYRRALHDEAAHSRHSELMFAGLRQACKRGLHLNSTVNGKGNAFARIALSKTTTFTKIRLHWTRHPEKAAGLACLCGWTSTPTGPLPDAQFDAHRARCPRPKGPQPTSPWYLEQQADSTPEQIASELDISYERSVSARVFDGYDATRHFFDVADQLDRRTGRPIGPPAVGEETLAYRRRALAGLIDPAKPIVLFWDFGVSDETFVAIGQVEDDALQATRWLDEIIDTGKDWAYYHALIVTVWYPAILEAHGWTPTAMRAWATRRQLDWSRRAAWVPDLQNELPRGILPVYHAGDPTGRNRDSSLGSWISNLALADPPMLLQHVPFTREHSAEGSLLEWIDHCRQIVRRDGILVSSLCARLADALGGWRWPTDKEGHVLPGRQLPKHDLHSHPATALVMGYRTRWLGQLLAPEHADRVPYELVGVAGEDDQDAASADVSLQWATRRRSIEPNVRRRGGAERALYGTTDDEDDDAAWDDA